MATILITGVTGTVINPLCVRLLEDGHTIVALVRPTMGTSSEERLRSSINVNGNARDRLFTLQGDITKPFAGVSQEDLRRWRGRIDKVVHGAASTKFEETPEMIVCGTNIFGTQQVLLLAEHLGVQEFHHVSTAYVGGDREEFSEHENAWDGRPHRNVYERSKAYGEELVHNSGMRYSIYRIPIVIGSSHTGEINSFTGYYGFLAPFWQLRKGLLRKLQQDGTSLKEQGVWVDRNDFLHIPLAIPCSKLGPINLVPVDWLSIMMAGLVRLPATHRTFHLTNSNPPGVKDIMVASLACLGFQDIACGEYPQENLPGVLERIQRGILKNVAPYLPYIRKDREVFHNQTTVQALGEDWNNPPEISPRKVGTFLTFAKRNDFGRS